MVTIVDLTPRQLQLVEHLIAGRTVEDAARRMKISPGTARVHLKKVHLKTGIKNRAMLVRWMMAQRYKFRHQPGRRTHESNDQQGQEDSHT